MTADREDAPGVSHDAIVETILDGFVFFEEGCRTSLWVARVPPPSNVADLPSRRGFSFLQSIVAVSAYTVFRSVSYG